MTSCCVCAVVYYVRVIVLYPVRVCCSVQFCSVRVIVIILSCPSLFFCPVLFCHAAVLFNSVLSRVMFEFFAVHVNGSMLSRTV